MKPEDINVGDIILGICKDFKYKVLYKADEFCVVKRVTDDDTESLKDSTLCYSNIKSKFVKTKLIYQYAYKKYGCKVWMQSAAFYSSINEAISALFGKGYNQNDLKGNEIVQLNYTRLEVKE